MSKYLFSFVKIFNGLNKFLVIVAILGLAACSKLIPSGPDSSDILAEPIEGLTQSELDQFIIGDEAFAHVFSAEQGLGPIYIQNSCESCHFGDGKGHPVNTVTRFGRWVNDSFDYLLDKGGPQLQPRSLARYPHETIPSSANAISNRIAPIVTGMGYLASVSDQTLLSLADPYDSDGDGISGRVNYVKPKPSFEPEPWMIDSNGFYIGRFGKKAKEITIRNQIAFALKEDLGLSSDMEMNDLRHPNMISGDGVAEPEVALSVIEALEFYMLTLKAPTRRMESDPDVVKGEQLFASVGCEKCHKSTLLTSTSKFTFLSEKEFHPYTDLLLHDMGPALDDSYPEGSAKSSEWRTPPLWGLGLAEDSQGQQGYYLHDGRAKTLEAAIAYHASGEAAGVVERYNMLSQTEKEQLLKFLRSL